MLTLTRRLPADATADVDFSLSLTAEERTRSRHHFHAPDGQSIYLQLPRGTVLQDGDLLEASEDAGTQHQVRILAKPEPVLTVTAAAPLDLMRAAYHLGNRHVPLEVAPTYLRLSPDPVLQDLLQKIGLNCVEEVLPFQPEVGAYGNTVHNRSSHSH